MKPYLTNIINSNKIDNNMYFNLVNKALFLMGKYYYKIHNFDKMKKYLKVATRNGYCDSMNLLGYYYYTISNYGKMKQYYKIAIDKKDNNAMRLMGKYYETINYTKMKKYYKMAIENNNIFAMTDLAFVYKNKLDKISKYEKYLRMALKNCDVYLPYLIDYIGFRKYSITSDKLITMAIEEGNKFGLHLLCNKYMEKLHFNNIKITDEIMKIAKDSFDTGNKNAAFILGKNNKDNVTEMIKYYLIAIDSDNIFAIDLDNLFIIEPKYIFTNDQYIIYAMHALIEYYYNTKNYDEMKKYCLMDIDINGINTNSNTVMIDYYTNIEHNPSELKKYKHNNYSYNLVISNVNS